MREAAARVKINRLLEEAGWRFFSEGSKPANVCLEAATTLTAETLADLGEDFEGSHKGYVDFLLLDQNGRPLVVLEAKAEERDPLDGKEQARRYARAQNCRFVILSNGNLHYFWDLERGNPHLITAFPTPDSVVGYRQVVPNPARLVAEQVDSDYIVLTQRPMYQAEAGWRNEAERPAYIQANRLRFLRDYQLAAVHAVQRAVAKGQDRFLFEMATGTGKTLTAAAVIKLFLRTRNAQRVLFLVDRLELEEQAKKAFVGLLSADFTTVIYKERRDEWRRAEIVVTTVQSLLFNNKYQRLFSPTDFDLVISDEAHRSISGNARAVFDFFVGYKLGLTATPRDYLRGHDQRNADDPRETERRLMLDTYRTFGCGSGEPTFRYSLLDGVRDGVLISPTVVDARTHVTTQLLSADGFRLIATDDEGVDQEQTYRQRDFERGFFSAATNRLFCATFLDHGLSDPISGEFGKSIIFAVSQDHASKLTQILNLLADQRYPGRYQSNFAVQVTSRIPEAQQHTVQFANNNLLGSANFLPDYRTSTARVCVTVGMMTTGYDCPDLLNIGLFRPIFSPTEFVQIKGRGTRPHDFREQLIGEDRRAGVAAPRKVTFKLFDFFANCEYFEEQFDYDQVLKLPRLGGGDGGGVGTTDPDRRPGEYPGRDELDKLDEKAVGADGMKVDRMLFDRFGETVREDPVIVEAVEQGQWDRVLDYVNREVFNRPEEFYTLEKLRRAAGTERRVTLREILEKVFGLIPRFKSKEELLEEEFAKFIADHPPEPAAVPAVRHYFQAYLTSGRVRDIIDQRQFADLATNPVFSTRDLRAVPEPFRTLVPEYVKDYVSLNQFAG